MTDKKIFGKLAGSAFQAVGTAASAVGKAASAVGEKLAKSDADESSAEKSETPELESDDLTDEDRAFLEALGLEADCRDEKSGKFHWGKIAEIFKSRQKAEPVEPAPKVPELPQEARVWGARDVSFFQTYMTKKKQVVFYKDLRRLHLKVVRREPQELGAVGRAVVFALGVASSGASVVAQTGDWDDFSKGAKTGAALGFIDAVAEAGAKSEREPKLEEVYQIWLEADGLPEPLLLTEDRSKLWANAMILAPTLDALKKSGVKPELWRNGKKCWSRSVALTHF